MEAVGWGCSLSERVREREAKKGGGNKEEKRRAAADIPP